MGRRAVSALEAACNIVHTIQCLRHYYRMQYIHPNSAAHHSVHTDILLYEQMSSVDTVKEAIRGAVDCTHLVVIDNSGGCDGSKYAIYIGSDQFIGMSIIERHRLVQSALQPHMSTIHAVEIKPYTLEQWNKKIDTIPTQ